MLAWFAIPVLAVLATAVLARWAQLRQLPLYLTLPLVLSILIPMSIVVLVPIDLMDSSETLDSPGRLIMWRVIYWLSFALTWLVLPTLQYYVESGYYDPWLKFRDALRSAVRYQLIMAGAGLAGLLYMGLSSGLSFTNLKSLAVALSHSYALVITIWLLGHGLVNVPRDVWYDQPTTKLHNLYNRATAVSDASSDAQANYDDAVAKIMALEQVKTAHYAEWIDDLVEDIRQQDLPLSRSTTTRAQPRDLTEANVASLARRLFREQARAIRSRADWHKLLDDVSFYEDIANASEHSATAGKELVFRRGQPQRLSPRAAYIFYVQIRPWLNRIGAVVLGVASVVIVWSELLSGTRLSLVDILIKRSDGARLLLAAAFLGYMCFVTFVSLTHLRVFNLYALVHRHSDPSSLIFYSMYFCRLAVPLSYNFLVLNSTQRTVFQEFLGKFINLTALGKYFNEILPRLILIPIAFTLFNLYETIKDYLGFGFGGFDDDEESRGSALLVSESEGRELVRRALEGQTSNYRNVAPEAAPLAEPESFADRLRAWF